MSNIFIPKVIRKLRLNHVVFGIIKHFNNEIVVASDEAITNSERLLDSKHPNMVISCLIENTININPQFDLVLIIPSYNAINYIESCLDSIINQQTEFSFQVKVIDDGSTDGTWEFLQKYQKHSNVVLIRKTNGGSGSALNEGLKVIDAKYVMFVDADDQLMPNAIQCLMSIAKEHQDVDIVEGQYEYFNSYRTITRSHGEFEISDDWTKLQGYQWLKIYKSYLFDGMGFPENCWHQDTVGLMLRYSFSHKIIIMPDYIYRYRKNRKGISFSAKKSYKTLDSFYVTKKLLEDSIKLGRQFTSRDYDIFLNQTAHNIYRIAWSKEKNVIKAVFILSIYLKKRFFSNLNVRSEKCKEIEEYIEKGEFSKFLNYCKYIY